MSKSNAIVDNLEEVMTLIRKGQDYSRLERLLSDAIKYVSISRKVIKDHNLGGELNNLIYESDLDLFQIKCLVDDYEQEKE